jgi:hypothetical protein
MPAVSKQMPLKIVVNANTINSFSAGFKRCNKGG